MTVRGTQTVLSALHATRRARLRGYAVIALLALLSHNALAAITIEVTAPTDEIKNNVRAFLSLTRYLERKDLDQETRERLQARIPAEARSAMQPLGYYEPEITYQATQKKADWIVSITVVPGRAVRVSEVNVDIQGEGRADSHIATVIDRSDFKPGKRLNHGAYDAFKAQLLRAATSNGYLEARWLNADLAIDRAERRAYATLVMDTGPRYRFGKVSVEQNVIHDDKVRRLLRVHEGDYFSNDAVLQSQYFLDDTQYFSPAEVTLGDRDIVNHTVPVNVTGKPGLRNTYSVSLGYGTDTRARGKLTWDNHRINEAGHRTKLELTASDVGREEAFHYIIPVRDIALEKLEFTLSDTRELLGDVTSFRQEFVTALTQVPGKVWQRVLYIKLSQERSVYAAPDPEVDTRLIIPGIQFATLPTHILGQETRRYSASADLSGSPSSLGSGASFIQLMLKGERIFDLRPLWHLRLKGQIGASWMTDSNFSELPASVRFFAGGDDSVRGFGLNELSPLDANGKRVGARNVVVGTVEVERDLPRNLRLATFYDIGNAIDHFSDPLEYSVGVGLRYHISIASVGIDVAQPLSVSGRTPRLHFHISTLF